MLLSYFLRKNIKACAACKFYNAETYDCNHKYAATIDIVTADINYKSARECREEIDKGGNYSACGLKSKWFEGIY